VYRIKLKYLFDIYIILLYLHIPTDSMTTISISTIWTRLPEDLVLRILPYTYTFQPDEIRKSINRWGDLRDKVDSVNIGDYVSYDLALDHSEDWMIPINHPMNLFWPKAMPYAFNHQPHNILMTIRIFGDEFIPVNGSIITGFQKFRERCYFGKNTGGPWWMAEYSKYF